MGCDAKLPKIVRLMGLDHAVVIDDTTIPANLGSTRYARLTLRVTTHDSDEQFRPVTLLHESVHKMNDMLELGMEETDVQRWVHGLVQLARDNPAFWCSLAGRA